MEKWINIKGFENLYAISNNGKVKSLDRKVSHKTYGSQFIKGVTLKQDNKRGYFSVSLCSNGNIKKMMVHRLVALHFVSNPNEKLEVNHKDGNKQNNNFSNLEWVTSSENTIHSFKNKLQIADFGENHKSSKLTELQAKEIKYSHLDKTQDQIAKIFNICRAQVSFIRNGKAWKHI